MKKRHDTRYVFQIHSWCTFTKESGLTEGSFDGPCSIVHHIGDRVWVGACYSDELPAHVAKVTDGTDENCFDRQGCCVVSVAVEHVKEYHTDEEAHSIFCAMDADARLLSSAR